MQDCPTHATVSHHSPHLYFLNLKDFSIVFVYSIREMAVADEDENKTFKVDMTS